MRTGTVPAAAGGLRAYQVVCERGPRRRASVVPVGLRAVGGVLPRRRGAAADWDRFVAFARLSRSAVELLTAVLRRPVRVVPVDNRVFEIEAGPDRQAVRVVRHRLVDSRAPGQVLALSATALVGARLPDCVRPAARRGAEPLSELLDRAGVFWTPETLGVERLTETGGQRIVRITRRLFLLGTRIADVVEDIPFPEPPTVRGPPAAVGPATEAPPAAGSG